MLQPESGGDSEHHNDEQLDHPPRVDTANLPPHGTSSAKLELPNRVAASLCMIDVPANDFVSSKAGDSDVMACQALAFAPQGVCQQQNPQPARPYLQHTEAPRLYFSVGPTERIGRV